MDTDQFSPIDYLTAEIIQANQVEKDDNLAALFTRLAASFRQGELSIEADLPDLAAKLSGNPYVVYSNGRLYLERAWYLLERIDSHLKELEGTPVDLSIDLQSIESKLSAFSLLPEQRAAISHSLAHSVSCIWGGPGTGKTYTAGWLVMLFSELFPQAKIALTAPTGKACANLSLSIQRACKGSFETKTLHALLGIRRLGVKSEKYKPSTLPYDLILVDESSMIDAGLFLKLLEQIKPGSRVVFLGDPDQLPPVEPGEPFSALVESWQKAPGKLVTTKRQEEGAILLLARHVLDGDADAALSCFSSSDSLGIFSLDDKEAMGKLLALHQSMPSDVPSCFKALQNKRLLCPLREGKFGVMSVNLAMERSSFLPIMVTQNDYHLNLTNGQVGIVHDAIAYFEDFSTPGAFREIPEVLLPSYEIAFCLSVHKSQGSEFDEVALLLPEGSERFGRRMLYTAITRARKRFFLYGSEKTFRACLI